MGLLSMRIGARSSRLSQAQTAIVSDLISKSSGGSLALEFVPVKTLGDRMPPDEAKRMSGASAGVKGAFTGDLEALLLKGQIDIAIHSMKDMTSQETEGLVIGATPPRSDPRDALVTHDGETIETLPKGAKVGTSSLRRRAQLLKMRGDIEVIELHGNVDTRLRKVSSSTSDLDAVVVAAAGLRRLGEEKRISQTFTIDEMVPAVGQGIIAVQMRRDDRDVGRVLSLIDDQATSVASRCERAFARRLGADCNVPVGGCATISAERVRMVGMVANDDGSEIRQMVVDGSLGDAAALGTRLADQLLEGSPVWPKGGTAS